MVLFNADPELSNRMASTTAHAVSQAWFDISTASARGMMHDCYYWIGVWYPWLRPFLPQIDIYSETKKSATQD
jgi:hypothetical protein